MKLPSNQRHKAHWYDISFPSNDYSNIRFSKSEILPFLSGSHRMEHIWKWTVRRTANTVIGKKETRIFVQFTCPYGDPFRLKSINSCKSARTTWSASTKIIFSTFSGKRTSRNRICEMKTRFWWKQESVWAFLPYNPTWLSAFLSVDVTISAICTPPIHSQNHRNQPIVGWIFWISEINNSWETKIWLSVFSYFSLLRRS